MGNLILSEKEKAVVYSLKKDSMRKRYLIVTYAIMSLVGAILIIDFLASGRPQNREIYAVIGLFFVVCALMGGKETIKNAKIYDLVNKLLSN